VFIIFSLFSLGYFLKGIENILFMLLSSNRNTHESLGELEKAVETLSYGSCSHSISRSPKLPPVFLQLDRNTEKVFYFLKIDHSSNCPWGFSGPMTQISETFVINRLKIPTSKKQTRYNNDYIGLQKRWESLQPKL